MSESWHDTEHDVSTCPYCGEELVSANWMNYKHPRIFYIHHGSRKMHTENEPRYCKPCRAEFYDAPAVVGRTLTVIEK